MLLEEKRVLREIRDELHGIRDELHSIVAFLYRDQSTTAVLTTSGDNLMATTAVLTFTDATGTPSAPPTGDGSGITVSFYSDNPAVTIGVAVAATDSASAPITGTDAFNLSAVVGNSSGAPLLDNDGVTDFVQPSPIAVAASTPQTTTAVLSTE
jgi:hypothetical protein